MSKMKNTKIIIKMLPMFLRTILSTWNKLIYYTLPVLDIFFIVKHQSNQFKKPKFFSLYNSKWYSMNISISRRWSYDFLVWLMWIDFTLYDLWVFLTHLHLIYFKCNPWWKIWQNLITDFTKGVLKRKLKFE